MQKTSKDLEMENANSDKHINAKIAKLTGMLFLKNTSNKTPEDLEMK
jgi:hypothetical protein